jgi:transketolase
VLRESDEDLVTIIGAGITVHEALAAADALAAESISARIIDLYSVKPIDEATLREAARVTGRLLTVEDHWAEGGVGSAVADVFAGERDAPVVRRLAVRTMPGSGPPSALRSEAGIDAAHIVEAARNLVREF